MEDAERVLEELRQRFRGVRAEVAPGQDSPDRVWARGSDAVGGGRGAEAGPRFEFLGFTHICQRSRRGKFTIHVRTNAEAAAPELETGFGMVSAPPASAGRGAVRLSTRCCGATTSITGARRTFAVCGSSIGWSGSSGASGSTGGPVVNAAWRLYDQLLAAYPLQRPYIARPWASGVSHV